MRIFGLIAIMAISTYLVRMIPFVVFRSKVENPFLKSLLYYLPYAILSAMTFPAILYATGDITASAAGLAAGIILGLFDRSLVEIALATSFVSLIIWFFQR